jgi:hypothetical protein
MAKYTEYERALAARFRKTMEEGGYWDIPLDGLKRLVSLGIADHAGCGRYSIGSVAPDEPVMREESSDILQL